MHKKVHKKAIIWLLLGCLLIICWPGEVTQAETIHVDHENGPYFHIQDAIDAAADGDTVFVHSGLYNETLVIDKQITLQGESKRNTVINGEKSDHVITVRHDDASVAGCKITNGANESAGLFLKSADNITISNCKIQNHDMGIWVLNSNHNTIRQNDITNATSLGLQIEKGCTGNIIFHNDFYGNDHNAYDQGYGNDWYNAALCEGNYWDDYQGEDDDKDGIGDTHYLIPPHEELIYDSYPLMQEYAGINILHMEATPQMQEPGGNVNLSCCIASSAEVNWSYINLTLPNGTHQNATLSRIGNTTSYYFNRSYSQKGAYYYVVWAKDTNNQTITSLTKEFVIAYKPEANFTVTPDNPTDMDVITFDGSGSTDSDGEIVNYTWDFGDGTVAYGETVSHNYSDNRNYPVVLTVIDNDSAWDTATVDLSVANVPPTADFILPQEGLVEESIQFTDQSWDAENLIVMWNWSFGDGTTVEGGTAKANPLHIYHQDGVFNVTLTVTDYDFDTGTVTKQIEIMDVKSPSISNVTALPNPQEVDGKVNISCTIVDDVAVTNAKVDIEGPGTSCNVSMHRLGDTTTWYYTANYSTGGNYTYAIWITDPSGNTNHTQSFLFEIIVPAAPPEIHDLHDTPAEKQYGFPANISCNASDNVALSAVAVKVRLPNGSSINVSMDPFRVDEDGNGIYFYNQTYFSLGNYSYTVWATDVNDHLNLSSTHTFSIIDTMSPQLDNLSITPAVQRPNGTVNVSCYISDNLAVQKVSITVTCANHTVAYKEMNASPLYYLEGGYSQPGGYNITIQATDTVGNTALFSGQFLVTAFPIANFSYSPAAPTSRDAITFTDASTDSDGSIQAWHWDFGDGNTSVAQHPTHSYAADGTFTVTLTITDDDGATVSLSKEIEVQNVPPTVTFTYAPAEPTDVDAVVFNASGSTDPDGTIDSYTWQFGNGNGSSGATTSHTYADNGTYLVTLTVTDDDGASQSLQRNITVDNVPPVADFEYAVLGQQVGVSHNASDPDGIIVNWTWDLGDGATEYGSDPLTHSYDQDGSYLVTLLVTDDDGASNYSTTTIRVGNVVTANFSYRPQTPMTEEIIAFNDSSMDSEGNITSWSWSFGDGNTSNEQHPSHSYEDHGIYKITLTVADSVGVTDTISTNITVVNAPPTANFSFTPRYPDPLDEILFNGSGSSDHEGSIVNWTWDMDDGTRLYGGEVAHSYEEAGRYNVTLTVTDDDGATDRDATTITIQSYREGDPTDDGRVDSADLQVVLQHVVGTYTLTGAAFEAADVYPVATRGDGTIDSADAQVIAQHVVGTYTIPA